MRPCLIVERHGCLNYYSIAVVFFITVYWIYVPSLINLFCLDCWYCSGASSLIEMMACKVSLFLFKWRKAAVAIKLRLFDLVLNLFVISSNRLVCLQDAYSSFKVFPQLFNRLMILFEDFHHFFYYLSLFYLFILPRFLIKSMLLRFKNFFISLFLWLIKTFVGILNIVSNSNHVDLQLLYHLLRAFKTLLRLSIHASMYRFYCYFMPIDTISDICHLMGQC